MGRILETQKLDKELLGKHLPSRVSALFPYQMVASDDNLEPPIKWVQMLQSLSKKRVATPKSSQLTFGIAESSLVQNAKLLQDHQHDLEALLASQKGTTVGHGSEFRPWEDVYNILQGYPGTEFLETIFCNGLVHG